MDMAIINTMIIPIITIACLCIGYVMKKWMPQDDKYIPTALFILGAVFVAIYFGISFEGSVKGMVSGLAAVGLHEAFTQFLKNPTDGFEKALKQFRQGKDAEKRIVHTSRGIKQVAIRYANKLKYFATRNVTVIVAVATLLVVFIVVSAGFSSCALAFSSATGTYMGGTSDATDFNMTDTDSYFTQKEMELQEKIDNIQTDHPGYDEYVFDIDDIGHDPAKLMAYLSSRFGSYELATVKSELDSFFDCEKRCFFSSVAHYQNNNFIEYIGCTLDNINMPQCYRIKAAGANCFFHIALVSPFGNKLTSFCRISFLLF